MTDEPTLFDLPACPGCGTATLVDVQPEAWDHWAGGYAPAWEVFPTLSDGDRTLLETGTHPDCNYPRS